jgi:isopenicillin N synthase-like dioxygenase
MLIFDQALPQVAKRNRELFDRLVNSAHAITMIILDALSKVLNLEGPAHFHNSHRDGEPSLSTMSVFRYPKQENIAEGVGHHKHTDLGTLTFLLTSQWGLQVLSPEANAWQFVKPMPDRAIVNVGDSLRFLSGFRLKSAVHQVLPLYGVQHEHRFSVAYFLRAEDNVEYEDSEGRRFTSKKWHDTKFDVFRETHDKQELDSYLTGGMERRDVLLV